MSRKFDWKNIVQLFLVLAAGVMTLILVLYDSGRKAEVLRTLEERVKAQELHIDTYLTNQFDERLDMILSTRAFEEHLRAVARSECIDRSNLVSELLRDEQFHASIVHSIQGAPTKGFLRTEEFEQEMEGRDSKIEGIEEKITRLQPIYEAIDIREVGNVLSVPIIRKDISRLSDDLGTLRAEVSQEISGLKNDVAVDTGRIYDLAKWLLGILYAALALPVIERHFKKVQGGEARPEEGSGPGDKPGSDSTQAG